MKAHRGSVLGRAAILLMSLILLTKVADTGAIYPEDHWTYSTKISDEQHLHSLVQEEIDAGRTLFVRWIASPAWGWWQKQAPSWNNVVRAFAGNQHVHFADINLQETSIRAAPYNPGSDGWPMVRYFNEDTGKDGAPYQKKTPLAMCDELGDFDRMIDYVEEAGFTTLCAINGSGCDDRSAAYMDKMKDKSKDEQEAQLIRLESMEGSMKENLKDWIRIRKRLLRTLINNHEEEDKAEL